MWNIFSSTLLWLVFRTTSLHAVALRSEAHIGKFHSFIERNYVYPDRHRCPRGIRIGYFDVAADCDIPALKNLSIVTPTSGRRESFNLEFGFQNIWVLEYMKLCPRAQIVLKMDEDFSFRQSLCNLAKLKDSTAQITTDLSIGHHILRTSMVLEASNIFRSMQWISSISSKWFFYGWNSYRSEIAHSGAKTHYNINPMELYDLAIVQQDLGWSYEGERTLLSAESIVGLKSFYEQHEDEETDIFLNYTFSGEKLLDANYFATEPQYNRSTCNLDDPDETFLAVRPPLGGLNNMMNEIVQIMAISYILGRTLILPGLSLDKPILSKAGVDEIADFHDIFDVDRMQIILKGKMCVVKTGEISEELEHDLVAVPHGREAPLDLYRRAYGPGTIN